MRDIAGWLEGLGLGQYAATFLENGIDRDVLPDLTELDLEKLSVKLGHRKKLLKAIAGLQLDEREPSLGARHSGAERRQVTVMFLWQERANGMR